MPSKAYTQGVADGLKSVLQTDSSRGADLMAAYNHLALTEGALDRQAGAKAKCGVSCSGLCSNPAVAGIISPAQASLCYELISEIYSDDAAVSLADPDAPSTPGVGVSALSEHDDAYANAASTCQ